MAVKEAAPSLDERLGQGRTARDRTREETAARRDAHDPLFLQVKEATASVPEGYLPKAVRSGRLETVEGV